MTPFDLITDKLVGSNGQYHCPAHDDSTASLSVREDDDGKVLLHCHASCPTKVILDSLGLSQSELFPDDGNTPVSETKTRQKAEVVATYDYTDEQDHPLYQVRRYHPKRFSQHRWNSETSSWESRLGENVRRVPYHLRSLLEADSDRWVFIVEGERDVEGLEARGLVATTTAGGAGGWSNEYSSFFDGRRVAILPDNDDPGRDYARRVGMDLSGATEVRIVNLPGVPKKGDVTDYFARGGTRDELISLVRSSELFVGVPRDREVQSGPLLVTRAESVQPSETEWFWAGRIPFGKISIIDGNPGQGKSTMTVDLVARASIGRNLPDSVNPYGPLVSILLSAEDGMEDTIVPRLMAADADLSKILAIDAVKAGDGPERPWQLPGDLDYLRDLIVETGARIVVIDPLMAYLEPGVSSNNDQHVRRALHPLKMLADETGVAMVIVRHLRKSREGIAMLQGGGSVGIIGAARAGLVVGGDPNDPEGKQRVVAVSKMNLGEPAGALAFHLENSLNGAGRIVWDGPSPHTAETLLQPAPVADLEEVGRAVEWLKKFLSEPQPVQELLQRSRQMGWSDKILSRARKVLGVVDLYKADGMVSWSLPMGSPSTGRNENAYGT